MVICVEKRSCWLQLLCISAETLPEFIVSIFTMAKLMFYCCLMYRKLSPVAVSCYLPLLKIFFFFPSALSVIPCREWCLFSAVVTELWGSPPWAIFLSHLFCGKCFRLPGIFPRPINIKICQEQFKQKNLASNVSDYSKQLHFWQNLRQASLLFKLLFYLAEIFFVCTVYCLSGKCIP